MLRPVHATIAVLLLYVAPAFGSELLLSQPQDELADPASSLTIPVRPGEKVSVVAELYDRLDGGGWLGKNRKASEFNWAPSCQSSNPACPVAEVGSSIVVTINVPICMPLGSTTFTITMPTPPEGETAPKAANVTLT